MDDARLVWRVRGGVVERVADRVAEEVPLELRVNGAAVAVLMRTPGDDVSLAIGLLVGEGVVRSAADVVDVRCQPAPEDGPTVPDFVDVHLAPGVPWDPDWLRQGMVSTSACGVCGRASLDAAGARQPPAPVPFQVESNWLAALPDRLRASQPVFHDTGGVHAVALAGVDAWIAAEDVGRHNAFDKVVGRALQSGRLAERGLVAVVSGRVSFELVQKAVMAGLHAVVAVGAPTTLAVSLAADHDLLLAGFCRSGNFNVYAALHRLRQA